ncbi:hypothetical protein [Paramagnetospirillum magneticum]|uniref:hypothetical protein n=1 Tax=Paramagnetospirillum magneticum TaxID=84159 RepID=UPI0005C2353B|nr:hypothetical protein [Paramagnetospirillum magneticum]
MARQDTIDDEDKVRLLRALAFQIHRKRPAEEALGELLEHESKGGRRRAFRAGVDALAADGFTAAMDALGLFNDDALVLLGVLADSGDHRLLSSALGKLADLLESKSP